MYSILELERKVVDTGICTNCGACQGMCPYWKSYQGRTFVDYDCDRTEGRCKYFCPRMPADLDALRDKLFGGDGCDFIPELGPFRALYLTRAADPEIRKNAQHGGTMTALVEFALAEGFIDEKKGGYQFIFEDHMCKLAAPLSDYVPEGVECMEIRIHGLLIVLT